VTLGRSLAIAALGLGGLAAVAGSPFSSTKGQIDVDALASIVVHEQDHVDAVELAAWIRDQKRGLRVIDVRTAAEFAGYHVPSAENVPLERLSHAGLKPTDTVVLYSQGGAHAAQAWVMLRALGLRQVFFLSGGLDEWLTDVMSPVLPDDATPDEKLAFKTTAEISRYFGGVPTTGPRVSAEGRAGHAAGVLTRLKRRGC
jgi:3-mercaptopyruvate sulfurtransferase SseA